MFSYTKKLAIVVSTAFALTACDWSSDSVEATNTAPEAVSDSVSTTADTQLMGQLEASDRDGDSLSFSLSSEPMNGSVIVDTDGSYRYQPDPEFVGDDAFSFSVSDGELNAEGTISIAVEVLQVSFLSTVRAAFEQESQSTPLAVNGREFEQDVLDTAEFDDLIEAGEVSGND